MSARSSRKTVYVAMSGGVDSSVAAALLKRRGFRAVGVFMMPWQPRGMACQWRADRNDAVRVASLLDIPLMTWDFSRQYERLVASPMVRGYRRGITPNPDVECNRYIKFGLFLERALADGADFVATGHYARTIRAEGRVWISAARDVRKDQTYFLWAVDPDRIDRVLFPVGGLTKPQVRAQARRLGLPVAEKRDSQGVCFVGPLRFREFLKTRIRSVPGPVRDMRGQQVGTHEGASLYTIGQRQGLCLGGGVGPRFVVARDVKRNVITVGTREHLYSDTARLTATNWFGPRPEPGRSVTVKIRYRSEHIRAHIGADDVIRFMHPVLSVTPGQSAVLYRGRRLVGGGVIM